MLIKRKYLSIETIVVILGCLYFMVEPATGSLPIVLVLRRVLFAGICLSVFFVKNSWRNLLKYNTLLYLFLIVYYLTAFLFDHGPAIDQFLYKAIRQVPLLLLGYVVASDFFYLKILLFCLAIGQAIGAIFRLPFFLAGTNREQIVESSGLTVDEIHSRGLFNFESNVDAGTSLYLFFLDKMYFFSLLLVVLITVGLVLYLKHPLLKILLAGLLTPSVLLLIRCQMSAVILLFLFGLTILSIFIYYKSMVKSKKNKTLLGLSFIGIGVLVFVLTLFLNNYLTEVFDVLSKGEGFTKIELLFNSFLDDPIEALNNASNARLDLMTISWDAFTSNPIFGVGAYWGYDITSRYIGGHSTILDQFAQFGILGGIPLVLMFYMWYNNAWKISKYGEFEMYRTILVTLWTVYLIGCIFDPLFGNKLDQYTLLLAGITCGLKYLSKNVIPYVPIRDAKSFIMVKPATE